MSSAALCLLALCATSSLSCGGSSRADVSVGGASAAAGAGASAGTDGSSGGAGGSAGTAGGSPVGRMCSHPVMPSPAPPPEGATKLPCDLFGEESGPCVAAHSTVRSLYATYDGPLYQVKKKDGTTLDIAPVVPGGFAKAADQDAFCGAEDCTISIVFDQSGQGNHLTRAPGGGPEPVIADEATANARPAKFGAHAVYGLRIDPRVGYRNNDACGTAIGDDAETEYMVVSGSYYNSGCCFEYGNIESSNHNDGEGSAEAIYFGNCTFWNKGYGAGPWVMADLENGLWAGSMNPYSQNPSLSLAFVTAMVKGNAAGRDHWTIKYGDAQFGPLTTPFEGPRPSARYRHMIKQGAIGLGVAGDGSSAGRGEFFEGAMTARFSSNAADDAVHANVVTVYGAPQP
jgi:hypothetical protein